MKFFNVIEGADNTATILLYGDMGEGDAVDSGRVVAELTQMAGRYERIKVRINSRGGDVFAGMAIYNALRRTEGDITIYVDGMAASIAAVVALCGKPLMMSPYARLMVHQVSGGGYGGAEWLRSLAGQIESLEADLATMLSARMGLTPDEVIQRYFDGKDHWFTADEAVNMGIADGIYDMTGGTDLSQSTDEEIYTYFNNRYQGVPQNNEDMALIDDIKALPTFKDVADASAVVAHIKELENKATKIDALQQANDTYRNQIAALQQKEVETFINQAVADGKITQEQVPAMTKLMNSDRQAAEELIGAMKARQQRKAADVFDGAKHEGLENKTWDQLDKENLLPVLKAQNLQAFAQKYKEKFGAEYNA